MTIHEKLAARIMTKGCNAPKGCGHADCIMLDRLVHVIKVGQLDDILGVREPTIEDVRRELARCLPGYWLDAELWSDGGIDVYDKEPHPDDLMCGPFMMRFHNVASAYAALRTLPDYEGEK